MTTLTQPTTSTRPPSYMDGLVQEIADARHLLWKARVVGHLYSLGGELSVDLGDDDIDHLSRVLADMIVSEIDSPGTVI